MVVFLIPIGVAGYMYWKKHKEHKLQLLQEQQQQGDSQQQQQDEQEDQALLSVQDQALQETIAFEGEGEDTCIHKSSTTDLQLNQHIQCPVSPNISTTSKDVLLLSTPAEFPEKDENTTMPSDSSDFSPELCSSQRLEEATTAIVTGTLHSSVASVIATTTTQMATIMQLEHEMEAEQAVMATA